MARSKRRGKGEGSEPKFRADGRWGAYVHFGYDAKGEPIRKWVYGRTRQECSQKQALLLAKRASGKVLNPHRYTLKEWLEAFVSERAAEVGENTRIKHRYLLSKIFPHIGHLKLADVGAFHIENLYLALTEQKLSPAVKKHVHYLLGAGFKAAYRRDIIERNPMDKVDPPKGGKVRKTGAWTAEEVRAVLAAAEGTRWYAPICLTLVTGLRIGELLALKWEDLKVDRLEIRRNLVRGGAKPLFGKPKTSGSERSVFLDTLSLELLSQHRQMQLEERSLMDERWSDFDLIFPSTVGTPMNLRNFRRTFDAIVKRAGVERRTPHGMRHTNITLLRGLADSKLVADRVGHSTTRMTDEIYNHVSDRLRRKIAISLEDILKANEDDYL